MNVAALFVRSDSHYKQMPGVDAYDAERDAQTWGGGCPAVFHPPCRAWGNYHRWAKPRQGEKELALWSLDRVRRWGGVIEHPASSSLWKVAGCLSLGVRDRFGGVLINVDQCEFGHRARKRTGLYIVGPVPEIPYTGAAWSVPVERMGVAERERTPPAFAEWLIAIARGCQ